MNEFISGDMQEKLGAIDQIRDIIFGSQLQEYSRRFEKIESDLAVFREETRERIAEAKDIAARELRMAAESLAKKIRTLSSISQEEWTGLRQQLEHTDKKFSNSLEALHAEMDTATASLHDELSQTRGKLQEDIRNLRAQIYEELDKRLSMLGDIKVSRDEMAEILVELGMQLKGIESLPKPVVGLTRSEVVPALGEATKSETQGEQ